MSGDSDVEQEPDASSKEKRSDRNRTRPGSCDIGPEAYASSREKSGRKHPRPGSCDIGPAPDAAHDENEITGTGIGNVTKKPSPVRGSD